MGWREIGPVPWDVWYDELNAVNSPILEEGMAPWTAAGAHSGLALAQLFVESQGGTVGRLVTKNKPFGTNPKNPLGLRPRRPPVGEGASGTIDLAGAGTFLTFGTWAACVKAWLGRVTDPAYAYADTDTLEEYIHKYAPNGDGANNEAEYVASVRQKIARWGLSDQGATVPATIDYSSLPFPVKVDLISPSQTNQRPGIAMIPQSTTWHETGNINAGAGARMHRNWLHNGAPGALDTQVSFHFVVDDDEVYQLIPLNEVAWHAGDGNGNGNMHSIAFECSVASDDNLAKAQDNQARLIALVHKTLGLGGSTNNFMHQHWSGKNCPAKLLAEPGGVARVHGLIDRYMGAMPGPTPPSAELLPGMDVALLTKVWSPSGIAPDVNGPVFKLYLAEAKKTGQWPVPMTPFPAKEGTKSYWRFDNGLMIWRPNDQTPVAILRSAP